MRIQYINGGLANQVYQYIFTRFAELSRPEEEPWLLDDSFFFVNNVHNGYELEKVFGIKANLLSKNFEPEVWEEFIKNKQNGISIPQSFKNLGFPIQMITEFDNYKEHNPFDGRVGYVPENQFLPDIIDVPGEITYYHGYWLDFNYFLTYRDILSKELSFPPLEDAKNLSYAVQILSTDSVAVHIRRGDYVALGISLTSDYYLQNSRQILEHHPDAVFFIFSDDIAWCKAHSTELGFQLPRQTVYVDGNIAGKNYIDLQLMHLCKGMLMSKSAFCRLAWMLNTRISYFCSEAGGYIDIAQVLRESNLQ